MNPVLPPILLFPILLFIIAGGAWLSWRSTQAAPTPLRRLILIPRLLALFALALFLINPGKWQAVQDSVTRVWAVMIDRSRSMSITGGGDQDQIRIDLALELAHKIKEQAEKSGVEVHYYGYDNLPSELDPTQEVNAEGEASDLESAADVLLTRLSSRGDPLAGVIVLSDGRQTHTPRNSSFSLRAQALQVPFHAIALGDEQTSKDLSVSLPRKTITAFPGQSVQLTAVLTSEGGIPPGNVDLVLLDSEKNTIAQTSVALTPDKTTVHAFPLIAPEATTQYTVKVLPHAEELRLSNNQAEVHLRILDNKAKVFIAEGAPYWDSKFLAQLLRQQKHIDVVSVHRLSETRWFRIDSGESSPHESDVDVFPSTKEELMSYDLIVFGKNSEHFLTTERIANLRAFVKDQGGAVLFSRSKPYTGEIPDLAPLEPVSWKTGITGAFRLRPTQDGEAAGLFGEALPSPDSSVWSSLPELKDAHRIDTVKPFTRVLAHGELGNNSTQGRFPLLLVRRYGQGVTGLVNADGLWKWDFFPEARELGNMYQEFWIQMIHWMLSYSEFLPGQDFSLHLSATTVEPNSPIALRMAYRGQGHPQSPQIEVTSATLPEPLRLAPAALPSEDGSLRWGASFTPENPGSYQIRLIRPPQDSNSPSRPIANGEPRLPSMPEAAITVLPPPGEMDELSANPEFLSRFCAQTGGKVIASNELTSFLDQALTPLSPQNRDRGVEWKSSWMRWFIPILVILCLATEWWLRRRNGLL